MVLNQPTISRWNAYIQRVSCIGAQAPRKLNNAHSETGWCRKELQPRSSAGDLCVAANCFLIDTLEAENSKTDKPDKHTSDACYLADKRRTHKLQGWSSECPP